MKTRHKPPSLVSMWMLDVFCCALGCVTLLWLLSTREAKREAVQNAAAVEQLAKTRESLAQEQAALLATKASAEEAQRRLNAEVADLQGKLLAAVTERDATATQLAATNARMNQAATQAATELKAATERAAELGKKLAASSESADGLAVLLRDKEKERAGAADKLAAATTQLQTLDAKARAAGADLDAMRKAAAASRQTSDDLTKANATIIDLQGQKAKLADKFDKLKAETESRFAGIALTGRRVVFVVDISGSMKLVDEKTPAADKWPTVIETVAKVMRSLPDLEKYQVVIFSRDATMLLGSTAWQTYQGEPSVRQVTDALKKVNPDGDTNMYDALDMAFRLRESGLDTLYLFSDGLPTSGPGLTPEQDRKLSANERTDRLSKHVLRTLRTTWNRGVGGQRVRIHAIGFFYESPDVGAFLWALARDNDGSFVGMSKP